VAILKGAIGDSESLSPEFVFPGSIGDLKAAAGTASFASLTLCFTTVGIAAESLPELPFCK
jgi:hypothetical protein